MFKIINLFNLIIKTYYYYLKVIIYFNTLENFNSNSTLHTFKKTIIIKELELIIIINIINCFNYYYLIMVINFGNFYFFNFNH